MEVGRFEFLGVGVDVVLSCRFKNVGNELAWCVVRACMARHGAHDRSSLAGPGWRGGWSQTGRSSNTLAPAIAGWDGRRIAHIDG